MRAARAAGLAVAALALGAGACAHGGRGGPAECAPPSGSLAREATADGLEGAYDLTLVTTEGRRAGAELTGGLTLMSQHADLRSLPGPGGEPYPDVTIPLIGSLEIALDSVGAVQVGSLVSTDPHAPGVAVYVRPGEILLRLGADANRRGQFAFEGGYTVLRVHAIDEQGFRGYWTSGGNAGTIASGYFCAVKQ